MASVTDQNRAEFVQTLQRVHRPGANGATFGPAPRLYQCPANPRPARAELQDPVPAQLLRDRHRPDPAEALFPRQLIWERNMVPDLWAMLRQIENGEQLTEAGILMFGYLVTHAVRRQMPGRMIFAEATGRALRVHQRPSPDYRLPNGGRADDPTTQFSAAFQQAAMDDRYEHLWLPCSMACGPQGVVPNHWTGVYLSKMTRILYIIDSLGGGSQEGEEARQRRCARIFDVFCRLWAEMARRAGKDEQWIAATKPRIHLLLYRYDQPDGDSCGYYVLDFIGAAMASPTSLTIKPPRRTIQEQRRELATVKARLADAIYRFLGIAPATPTPDGPSNNTASPPQRAGNGGGSNQQQGRRTTIDLTSLSDSLPEAGPSRQSPRQGRGGVVDLTTSSASSRGSGRRGQGRGEVVDLTTGSNSSRGSGRRGQGQGQGGRGGRS